MYISFSKIIQKNRYIKVYFHLFFNYVYDTKNVRLTFTYFVELRQTNVLQLNFIALGQTRFVPIFIPCESRPSQSKILIPKFSLHVQLVDSILQLLKFPKKYGTNYKILLVLYKKWHAHVPVRVCMDTNCTSWIT